MKFLLIWAFAFTSLVPASNSVNDGLFGRWSGQAIEPGRSDWYQVEINYNPGMEPAGSAHIYYGDYRCGGVLILATTDDSGETAIFHEVIQEGKERCIDQGIVTLEREGDKLIYHWSHPDWQHEATGILRQVD